MKPQEIAKLPPEKQLRLWLIQHGYPYDHIPTILRYCPQLLRTFTIEEIAIAALSDTNMYKPTKTTLFIRPFVMQAGRLDLEVGEHITDFVEESMSIFASDTIEVTLTDMIQSVLRRKGLTSDDTV